MADSKSLQQVGETLFEFDKLMPGLGLRTVTTDGFGKSATGKSLINAVYGAMIEVAHADLGVEGLINSGLANEIGRGETGAALMYFESPVPSLSKIYDQQTSDYIPEPVSTGNFAVHLDQEIYLSTKLSTTEMAIAQTNPAKIAAIMQSASSVSSYQMDMALTFQQVYGLFTLGGDTIKNITVTKWQPTAAQLKALRQAFMQEIVNFMTQLTDKRKLGLRREDLRLVVSPEAMTYLSEIFGTYPTIMGQSVIRDGIIYQIYGIQVTQCYLFGQNISKGVVSKDRAFDFSTWDMALVINGGFFYSPIYNFQPLTPGDQSMALGKLYRGGIRSTLISKKGGRGAFTDHTDANPGFKCVQRFKFKYTS